jgi:hypothetical protein
MPKIQSALPGTENVPRRRDGRLTFKEGYVPTRFENGSLQYLGKTEGFPMDLSFVPDDPWVKEEISELYGRVPQKWKGFSRSGASSDKLRKNILAYDHDYPNRPHDILLEQAIDYAFSRFFYGEKVKPLDHWDVPVEANTSAGWTWAGMRKKDVYRSAVSAAKRQTFLAINGKLSKRSVPPCMGFKRTQLSTIDKPKVRLVWGFPFEMTIREGRFAVPIVNLFEFHESPIFHGKTMLKELPGFIDSMFINDGQAVVVDWSGFDATLPPWLIQIAFKIVRQNLELSVSDETEFWNITDYFIRTPIVLNNGDVFVKNGGIPSGSYFTQVIGSICNFIILSYLQLKSLNRFCKMKVLGDDSISRLRKSEAVSFEQWSELAKGMFNMTLSPVKSNISSHPSKCDFLGHSARAGRVLRDEDKLVKLALYPEYRVDDPRVSAARVLGLLMDSGMRSPILLALYRRLEYKFGIAHEFNEKFIQYVIQAEIPSLLNDGIIWTHSGA